MSTLDRLVAQLAPVTDDELRDAVKTPEARALRERILATPRRRPRRLLVPALAGAAVAAACAVAVIATRPQTTNAALVLHRAAAAALETPAPMPGQYLYVHSTDVYLDTSVGATTYSALLPHDRQIWIGPSGGRVVQTNGTPVFPTAADRERWRAAGSPSFGRTIDETLPPARPLDLPTAPDALYAQLKRDAASFGDRFYDEIYQMIGDDLRETSATPQQRAALFAVASRLPGIDVDANASDGAGRRAIAVSKNDDTQHVRYTLLFDPSSYALLGEQQSLLAGNSFGYPAGMVIGSSTTLTSKIVDSIGG